MLVWHFTAECQSGACCFRPLTKHETSIQIISNWVVFCFSMHYLILIKKHEFTFNRVNATPIKTTMNKFRFPSKRNLSPQVEYVDLPLTVCFVSLLLSGRILERFISQFICFGAFLKLSCAQWKKQIFDYDRVNEKHVLEEKLEIKTDIYEMPSVMEPTTTTQLGSNTGLVSGFIHVVLTCLDLCLCCSLFVFHYFN